MIATVTKVTATQIVIGGDRYRKKDGYLIGCAGSWYHRWISLPKEDEVSDIVELGKKIQSLLSKISGHRHVVITEDDIILREEGMCLFHSDPF